jgi:hypothetical protein
MAKNGDFTYKKGVFGLFQPKTPNCIKRVVEVRGIEPLSGERSKGAATCLVRLLISRSRALMDRLADAPVPVISPA